MATRQNGEKECVKFKFQHAKAAFVIGYKLHNAMMSWFVAPSGRILHETMVEFDFKEGQVIFRITEYCDIYVAVKVLGSQMTRQLVNCSNISEQLYHDLQLEVSQKVKDSNHKPLTDVCISLKGGNVELESRNPFQSFLPFPTKSKAIFQSSVKIAWKETKNKVDTKVYF